MNAKVLTTLASALLGAASVIAVPYSDLQVLGDNVAAGTSVTHTFDLENTGSSSIVYQGTPLADQAGFDHTTMQAVSGFVAFGLSNAGQTAYYTVDLQGTTITSPGSSFTSVTVIFQGIQADLLVAINSTGKLEYTVSAVNGSFTLDIGYLEVDANSFGNAPVPDGGTTAILLGMAFLGLTSVRRVTRR